MKVAFPRKLSLFRDRVTSTYRYPTFLPRFSLLRGRSKPTAHEVLGPGLEFSLTHNLVSLSEPRNVNQHFENKQLHILAYEFTFHNGRLRIFRVTCTALLPKLLCPKANTTVSSAPRPRAIPRLRNSMASFANLNRAWSDPIIQGK
jgi:hypothetical protein